MKTNNKKTAGTYLIEDTAAGLEDQFAPGVGVETEDDITSLDPSLLGKAVVSSTDWTAETIIGQLAKGNISLDPIFQRRDAWTQSRKSKFIESIILGLPIPQLVLAEAPDKKGAFVVIDGKQRLLTLQQFGGVNLEEGQQPLKLTGLKIRGELNTKTYENLKDEKSLEKHLTAFDNQSIRTVVVKNWQDEDVLYVIFHRLNTGSVPLSPQELRQALLPGPFLRFAGQYSETSAGIQKTLGLDEPDFRMRDVELLVRYYAFKNNVANYSGSLKDFLDDACRGLNKRWKTEEEAIRAQANEMEQAIDLAFEIFGSNAFRKWDGQAFEKRFNRAIFDVVVYYFSEAATRKKASAAKSKILTAFKNLCQTDQDFLKSVETTTKSKDATSTRFTKWGQSLSKAISVAVPIPTLKTVNKTK
jgi:hypothetical protein